MKPTATLSYIALCLTLLSGCGSHVWHQVKQGDTLYAISFRYGQDYQQIAQWNGISAPYVISLGQRLRVSPPLPGTESSPTVNSIATQKTEITESNPTPLRAGGVAPRNSSVASRTINNDKVIVKIRPSQPVYAEKVAWHWPVDGKVIQKYSINQPGLKGIDIDGAKGTQVKSAASGRVVYAGEGLVSYGRLIIIKHNEHFLSAYAHNKKFMVEEGQDVKAGTVIAEMGDSGTDRVKLHFEVRKNGKPVNPLKYLPRR